jgi:PKD repeat protein
MNVLHFSMKLLAPILLLLFFSFSGFSQIKPCSTDELYRKVCESDPSVKAANQELEQFTKTYTEAAYKADQIYVIPVVFHIIHNYGEENISKLQVLDAIRVMNEDFRKLNPDTNIIVSTFQSIAADSRIEFRLAKKDPSGNCTDGITRTFSGLTNAADDNVKDLVMWDRSKYLNIWVVKSIASGAAGYSYYPGIGEDRDGVVVLHSYVGSTGTSSPGHSRTLTHEVGHYLNLRHTWGNSNEPGLDSNCEEDDLVQDTPNTIGHTSCNLSAVTCSSLDNVQNYMEYSYCSRMFTTGQKNRMRAALTSNTSQRNSLWQPGNLIATGTNDNYITVECNLVPDFKTERLFGCQGLEVQFNDLSYNGDPQSWYWEFPGGIPSVSTDQNPFISYPEPGIFPVNLTVSNSSGNFILQKLNYIRIADTLSGNQIPFSEGFENADIISNNSSWTAFNSGGTGWKRTVTTSQSGFASLKVDNKLNDPGVVHTLISPVIVPEGYYSSLVLNWSMAYSQIDENSDDELRIYLSVDCGNSWILRYIKSGAFLATTPSYHGGTFLPETSEWEVVSRDIFASISYPGTLLVKFEATSNSGNSLYLDNINLTGTVLPNLGLDNPIIGNTLSIHPNPADKDGLIEFSLRQPAQVCIEIRDVLGKLTGQKKFNFVEGDQTVRISNIAASISSGTYSVSLISSDGRISRKLIIH